MPLVGDSVGDFVGLKREILFMILCEFWKKIWGRGLEIDVFINFFGFYMETWRSILWGFQMRFYGCFCGTL